METARLQNQIEENIHKTYIFSQVFCVCNNLYSKALHLWFGSLYPFLLVLFLYLSNWKGSEWIKAAFIHQISFCLNVGTLSSYRWICLLVQEKTRHTDQKSPLDHIHNCWSKLVFGAFVCPVGGNQVLRRGGGVGGLSLPTYLLSSLIG